jgi:hypothetical protein
MPEGLTYDAAKRLLKKNLMPKVNPNARRSILNNVKIQEGESQAKALDMETREYVKGVGSLPQFNPRFGRGKGLKTRGGLGEPKPCSLSEGFTKVREGLYKKVYK